LRAQALDNFRELVLVRIADHKIYAGKGCDFFRGALCVAACDYDACFRVLAADSADRCARVLIGSARNRAGVQDHYRRLVRAGGAG